MIERLHRRDIITRLVARCDDAGDCSQKRGNFRGVCPLIGRLREPAAAYIAVRRANRPAMRRFSFCHGVIRTKAWSVKSLTDTKKRGEVVCEEAWTGARAKLVRRQRRRDFARDGGKATERNILAERDSSHVPLFLRSALPGFDRLHVV